MNLLKISQRLIFLSFFFFLYACNDSMMEESKEEMDETIFSTQESIPPELHAPNSEGEQITYSGQNFDFSYEIIDNTIVYEGDMILSEEQLEEMKAAADDIRRGAYHSWNSRRWPRNIVPYVITDGSLSARALGAMSAIEASTNIVFRLKNRVDDDYINFVVGTGCSSSVGRRGGSQDINLAPGCGRGATIHEICHALGMWHEHTRDDRNDNVEIHMNNVQGGRRHNFRRSWWTTDSGNFDFQSIMMYGPCAFSTACPDGQACACTAAEATITTRAGGLYAVQRNNLSAGDIAAIDEMYPWHWCTNTPCCGVTCIPGYHCVNGDCVVDQSNPPGCINDSDCPPGTRCNQSRGECIPL